MHSRAFAGVFALSIAAMALSGCQQLFTTSLATALARASLPLPATLTSAQATDLAAQAKANNDTKLASSLVAKLETQIAATTDPTERATLQASAASSAIIASGTSTALTGLITDYVQTNAAPSAASLTALLATIQTGASGTGVVDALRYLDSSSATGLSTDAAKAAGLGATDYAIAAVVIAASVIPAGSDPSTFDYATLSATDQATLDVAKNIIIDAGKLVDPNSASSDMLKQISDQFQLPTT